MDIRQVRKDYLQELKKQFSGMSIEKIAELIEKEEQDSLKQRKDIAEKRQDWFDSLVGRCFCLHLTNRSKFYFKVTEKFYGCTLLNETIFQGLYIVLRDDQSFIQKNTRGIKHDSFLCPYEVYETKKKPLDICKEITSEEYARMLSFADKVSDYIQKEFNKFNRK